MLSLWFSIFTWSGWKHLVHYHVCDVKTNGCRVLIHSQYVRYLNKPLRTCTGNLNFQWVSYGNGTIPIGPCFSGMNIQLWTYLGLFDAKCDVVFDPYSNVLCTLFYLVQYNLPSRTNVYNIYIYICGWWFGTFSIFPNSWDNNPIWLSYFSRESKQPTRYIYIYDNSQLESPCSQRMTQDKYDQNPLVYS